MSWINEKTGLQAVRMLKKNHTQKYIVTNRSDIKVNTLNIVSTNQCRWVLHVKDIKEDRYLLELLTLDNRIIETNNPMINDVAGFNNTFKEIYNELSLEVGLGGELLAVKNAGEIRKKWYYVREQLKSVKEGQQNIATVISLNDGLFESDDTLKEVIRSMEFFELFFLGFYGRELPAIRVPRIRNSKFRGEKMSWVYNFQANNTLQTLQNGLSIQVEGLAQIEPTESYIKKAYGQFDFLDYKNIKPRIHCEGKYMLNKETGMIEQATYNNYEIVAENLLSSKNQYTIESYE